MGGSNPFIEDVEYKLPTRKYTITFQPGNIKVEVDPDALPYGRDGLPGSVLDVALANDIEIDHACGGVCACSTCHVVVSEGADGATVDKCDLCHDREKPACVATCFTGALEDVDLDRPEHASEERAPELLLVLGEQVRVLRELLERTHQAPVAAGLGRTGGRIYGEGGAAQLLGLKPTTLQSRMKKLGLRRAG